MFLKNFVLFLLISSEVHAVMKAVDRDKVTFAYKTLRPTINRALQNQHLHADVIGRTAQPKTQCGVIFLDTSALTNGNTFEDLVVALNMTTNSELEKEYFSAHYNYTRHAAMNNSRAMIDQFTMGLPKNDEVGFIFVVGGLLVGAILGAYAYYKLEDYFSGRTDTDALMEQIGAWCHGDLTLLSKNFDQEIDLLRSEFYDIKYRLELARVYDQIQRGTKNVLTELFINNRIHPMLLEDKPGSVWHAIENMVGKSFNATILSKFRSSASKVIRSKVMEKSPKHLTVQVCFPAALMTDVDDLLEVAPFGHFSGNDYSFPILPSLYSLSEKDNEVSDLRIVRDLDCPTLGDITICPSEKQHDGCSLLLDKQTTCDAEHHNGTDGNFVLVRPLTYVSIIATNVQSAIYKDADADREVYRRLPERIFVATIPHGSSLKITDTEIKSRISSAIIKLNFNISPPLPRTRNESDSVSEEVEKHLLVVTRSQWMPIGCLLLWLISLGSIVYYIIILKREAHEVKRAMKSL